MSGGLDGEVAERLNAPVLKTGKTFTGFVSSNLTLSAITTTAAICPLSGGRSGQ